MLELECNVYQATPAKALLLLFAPGRSVAEYRSILEAGVADFLSTGKYRRLGNMFSAHPRNRRCDAPLLLPTFALLGLVDIDLTSG